MKREPVATTQIRQVRAAANILMQDEFFPAFSNCMNPWRQKIKSSRKVCFSTLIVMALQTYSSARTPVRARIETNPHKTPLKIQCSIQRSRFARFSKKDASPARLWHTYARSITSTTLIFCNLTNCLSACAIPEPSGAIISSRLSR